VTGFLGLPETARAGRSKALSRFDTSRQIDAVESAFWPALLVRVLTEPWTACFYQPNPKRLHLWLSG
jgi:hypothetical protein